MKFIPRQFKENVNISPQSPLRELFVLLGAITAGLLIIYLLLGFTLDILVERMPAQLEEKLGNMAEAVQWYKKIFAIDATYRDVMQKIQELG